MEDLDRDDRLNRPAPPLADLIDAKRREIEATGFCRWEYAAPPKILGPWFFFGGRLLIWIEATWPYEIMVRRGRRP